MGLPRVDNPAVLLFKKKIIKRNEKTITRGCVDSIEVDQNKEFMFILVAEFGLLNTSSFFSLTTGLMKCQNELFMCFSQRYVSNSSSSLSVAKRCFLVIFDQFFTRYSIFIKILANTVWNLAQLTIIYELTIVLSSYKSQWNKQNRHNRRLWHK